MTTSPFLATTATTPVDLTQLDGLIAQALSAKAEAERHKAIYDSLRDQICATLKDLGETKLECTHGKVRLKETKSGWCYSDTTEALAIQLKAQQDIEKRQGVAQPAKVSISADVFPLA
jgi:hypothetical protein